MSLNTLAVLCANPKAGYVAHKEEIGAAISRVLNGGSYILGEEVKTFEEEFARFIGAAHAVGVGSGTDAIQLALRACGIGPGDAVFTVSHTAVATVAAIELAGAVPVMVDVAEDTCTMDAARLEEAVSAVERDPALAGGARPRAVVAVHLYGQPADLPAIQAVAARHKLRLIEDAAQAHGAALTERKVGTWGDAAAFSFYPTKNLGALGDGGAVTAQDPGVAERVRLLREYGWKQRYVSDFPGMNSRLDEMQAAILRVKLRFLDEENRRRQEVAALYAAGLAGKTVTLPVCQAGAVHVYHLYVVQSSQRDGLQAHLKGAGIGTMIHYPVPVHRQPAYASRGLTAGLALPVTEALCGRILSLPMHPFLSPEDVTRVIEAAGSFPVSEGPRP